MESGPAIEEEMSEGVMSFGEDGGSEVEFETIQGRNWPTVTQFSVFLENRVGQLLEVVRSFQGSRSRSSACRSPTRPIAASSA